MQRAQTSSCPIKPESVRDLFIFAHHYNLNFAKNSVEFGTNNANQADSPLQCSQGKFAGYETSEVSWQPETKQSFHEP